MSKEISMFESIVVIVSLDLSITEGVWDCPECGIINDITSLSPKSLGDKISCCQCKEEFIIVE